MRHLAVVFSHYVASGPSGGGGRVSSSSNHRPISVIKRGKGKGKGKGKRAAISQPTIRWLAEIQPESLTRVKPHPCSLLQLLVCPDPPWGDPGSAPWQQTTHMPEGYQQIYLNLELEATKNTVSSA